ncbi:MAG: adenylate kinase [Planctomycetota bacterium]
MRIVFIGPPGAGKGTQAARVCQALGIACLSTGEVLRQAQASDTAAGREIAARLEAGELVPDDLVLRIVTDRLADTDCHHGFLFDGFPRTVPQAVELDKLMDDHHTRLDAAVLFEVGEQELLDRLACRGRADDKKELIRQRLRDYAKLTTPLAEYYQQRGVLHRIDAAGTTDQVYGRIARALGLP